MKKLISLLLAAMMLLSLIACSSGDSGKTPSSGNSSAPGTSGDGKVQVNGMLWGVEPLPKKTKITVSYLANSTAEVATYVADEKGWLDACNLEVEMVYFAGGPAQMEASNSWDCGTTGIGGMITGILNYDIKTLGVVAQDRGLFQAFFARKDSDIVAAGTGHTDVDGLYGTAETWKGKDIITAVGTANQYTLYNTLKTFGLGLNDVNVINMDIASTPVAFLAGQGDVGGIQGMQINDDSLKSDEYVLVSSDQMLKCGLSINYVANPSSWESKQAAIEKWLELAVMAGTWANDNQEETAEMMVDMFEIDGYETTKEYNLTMISENPFTSLDLNYQYFTEKAEGSDVLQAQAQLYDAMTGYVEMGNYTQDQLDALKAMDSFQVDPIQKIYKNAKG